MRSVARAGKLLGFFVRFGVELLLRRPQTRQARADWLHRFCAATLSGLEVGYTLHGDFPARGAFISNHQGYLDIVVLAALHPVVFCSKAEIAHWPVLGWMTTMAGTVYVERGRGGSALKAAAGMKAAAEAGLPVVFFPEGTTTNGSEVLPFHSGLLAQALEADEPVTAAFLHYTLNQPNSPGVTVADDVNYWGEVNLLRHIVRFLSLRGVHAHVRVAPGPVQFSTDALHRKEAAVEAREAVLALRN